MNRRDFLLRTLQGSSLVALGATVPHFIANTARAAAPGKDNCLVIIEMTGGNDGLNTVIPYADENYARLRPTLKIGKNELIKVDDEIGLNPGLRGLGALLQEGSLAVVQGVGYPNPDRSHFESMDVWHSCELPSELTARGRKASGTGWLARSVPGLQGSGSGGVPVMHISAEKLPLALRGSASGIVTVDNQRQLKLNLGTGPEKERKDRKELLVGVAGSPSLTAPDDDLLSFVRRRNLDTYTQIDRLQEVLKAMPAAAAGAGATLANQMNLVAQLIREGFGTRVFYLAIAGFDTHSEQATPHRNLLQQIGDATQNLFAQLKQSGHDKRTLVMTYSEFGRRAQENGSRGTDHGAGSCMFVAGPAVKAGAVNKHPSLTDLDQGDLKHHTDFRRVYSTLLGDWLGVEAEGIVNGKFETMPLLKKA